MSSTTFPVGVASVLLPTVGSTALPSFQTLTFSASGVTAGTLVNNGGRSTLAAGTYQVILTPLGVDLTNGGYTVGRGTPSSGNLVLSAGDSIKVKVANADLVALGGTIAQIFAISVWLKVGAADFKLADHAYVDPSTDFVHTVVATPRRNAVTKTAAILNSTTSDSELGSRSAYGCTFAATPTTTGGVIVSRTGDNVTFSPDNASNFDVKTTRTASISFSVLAADLVDVVRANAGTYVRYTDSAVDYEEVQMSEYTTSISVPGSKPLILVMPLDSNGYQPIRMYLGNVLQNQEDNTEAYTKDQQIEIAYNYSAVPNDTLTNNMNTEIHWKKRA